MKKKKHVYKSMFAYKYGNKIYLSLNIKEII